MIFLTVGTQFPFDRLVMAIDRAAEQNLLEDEVFAQIGNSRYTPNNFVGVASLTKEDFDTKLKEASCVISHAGIGSITLAMDYNKPLLAMPRLKKYHEVVNDHQVAIAKKFEMLKHILVAYEPDELPEKIKQLKSFVSRKRIAQPQAIAQRITAFLHNCAADSSKRR